MSDHPCKCGHKHSQHNNRKNKDYEYRFYYNVCMDGSCNCLKYKRKNEIY